jgi:2-polyprenyl-6-methoxyphenol hydroxylase-like FAD-dependent oxidoreductase
MKDWKAVDNAMSRRKFFKNTAMTGAAAFAVGAGGLEASLSAESSKPSPKTSGRAIREASRSTRVCRTADVGVVGGGPGGVGAALTAARCGANTVLVERYGHLGGMGTGGLVTIIPNLSDFNGKQQIAGISQEWIDRLKTRHAADHPKKEHWGSRDPKLTAYYEDRSFFNVRERTVLYSVHIDAEISKCILQDMMKEAGVTTYLHSWGTEPVMEGNKVKGVIFESKSGRQAIMSKIVIDATGDGDLLPGSGAGFDSEIDPTLRIANLSFSYWVANVDLKKYQDYKKAHSKELAEEMREIRKRGGHAGFLTSNLKDQDSLVWVFPRYANSSQVDVEELTRVEFLGRKEMLISHDFYKKNIPGFEKSFIVLTNPQLGTRGSRRVAGEYVLSEKDLNTNVPFEDTIAIFPDVDRGRDSLKYPLTYMPYRCMIPRKVNNLLVACRAFSSDAIANNFFNYIPHCIAMGEAAGVAAAQAAGTGVDLRKINIRAVQTNLKKHGSILP